jgi:hypothetical protein
MPAMRLRVWSGERPIPDQAWLKRSTEYAGKNSRDSKPLWHRFKVMEDPDGLKAPGRRTFTMHCGASVVADILEPDPFLMDGPPKTKKITCQRCLAKMQKEATRGNHD